MTLILKVMVATCLLMLAGALLACGGSDEHSLDRMVVDSEVEVTRIVEVERLSGAAGAMGAASAATAVPRPAAASATAAPAATTAPAATATAAPAAMAQQTATQVTKEVEVAKQVSEETATQSAGADVVASLPAQQRIIIRTVDMQLTVSDVAAAVDEVGALAGRSGGWVVGSDRSARHGGYIAIRVPAGSLDATIQRLRGLALEVESEVSTSEDVTDEYVDIQSRLKGTAGHRRPAAGNRAAGRIGGRCPEGPVGAVQLADPHRAD